MTRLSLKPFKNKLVMVTGRVEKVYYKNILDKDHTMKENVKILLKEVKISGIDIDHIWLLERNKQYDIAHELINQRVKFKALVEPYYKVNKQNNLFVQDYGIKRKSRLISEKYYMSQFQFNCREKKLLSNIDFNIEDFLY
ncbi:hypothetical protein [Staphylococcus simiae]|uniref:Uncharacterized protein n=1 Tax=Staphylococcus simiae CCM 7213 = CCUG 51256 TaxID=911238 RepID=G5JIU8_9STAP|nr:hypothetical protein [Staphylococcus simiae]EHJ07903.1 hypothetical protein SS7213T_06951 [Staphylococcus simiae CCM 7213 = CCUG 51256]PNZ12192.1 hypothetical protein CD113_07090 [Staphylococcus simiae]SNV63435.1 Uncharacterised protein [Staphylococcus simiae]